MTHFYAKARLVSAAGPYYSFTLRVDAQDFRAAADLIFTFSQGVSFASTFSIAIEEISTSRPRGVDPLLFGKDLPADLLAFVRENR